MAVVTPTNSTQPVQSVVAPTPASKQPRGRHDVKTDTAQAVDAPDQSDGGRALRRDQPRGHKLDILV